MRGEKIVINKKIKLAEDIQEFTSPRYIYVPLEDKNGNKYKCISNIGDYVYKGSIVAIQEDIDFPIHSSVSGKVIEKEDKLLNNGKNIECLVIENDYEDKYETKLHTKRNLFDYTKDEFISMLKNNAITGLGGSNYPTFMKYNANSKIKYLLINGVECEPYIGCDKAIINNYTKILLETINSILKIMNINKAYFVIKDNNINGLNNLKKYINDYPNIKIKTMPDIYPAGWEKNIVEHVLKKTYNNYPIEVGTIVSNVSTIYAIYEVLKYNKPLIERTITITGTGINKPTNIKVRIGTLISSVIEKLDGYKDMKKPLFIAGGPMMGESLPSDDLIITKDLNCILVIDDIETTNYPCINCGKCTMVCPVSLLPVMIMKNYNNHQKVKKLHPEKCIECGLCSYVCPSKIEVREYVRIAKGKVNKDETL